MNSPDFQPLFDHLLVAVPERFAQPNGPRNPDNKLGLTLLSGADSMDELTARIRAGLPIEAETDTAQSDRNRIRTGLVLAVPKSLTPNRVLCAAANGKVHTYADMAPAVDVGDTVYLDHSCLTDENEIMPGIYHVSYGAVICVIDEAFVGASSTKHPTLLRPVGGYVLLSRVWPDDVFDEPGEFGLVKCRKSAAGLVIETAVPPLPNEGVVAWIGAPLRGLPSEVAPGQRVLITPGLALVENICGVEYLVVRSPYLLAVREPVVEEEAEYFQLQIPGLNPLLTHRKRYEEFKAFATVDLGEFLRILAALPAPDNKQNPFTQEFQRLPLHLSNYDA